jgi:hypothetical protein
METSSHTHSILFLIADTGADQCSVAKAICDAIHSLNPQANQDARRNSLFPDQRA